MKQIGNKIIQLDVVDSTNNFAANLLKSGELVHGTVILADEQTAGKGQRGSTWLSEGGSNVIMSVFVEHDNLTVGNQETINHWVSLSILGLLKKYNISAQVKWPNDILVDGKKISGVLIENQLLNIMLRSSIIGVGLNVNQHDFGDLSATSIRMSTGQFHPVKEIAFQLIAALNDEIGSLNSENRIELKNRYHQNLWKIGERVQFFENEKLISGTLIGTNEQGLLQINVNAEIRVFDLKQIKFVLDE